MHLESSAAWGKQAAAGCSSPVGTARRCCSPGLGAAASSRAVRPLGTAAWRRYVVRARFLVCKSSWPSSWPATPCALPLGYRTQGYGLGGVCSARAAEVRARLGALSPGTPCWATCQRGVSDSAVSHVVGASVFSDHAQPLKCMDMSLQRSGSAESCAWTGHREVLRPGGSALADTLHRTETFGIR